MPEEPGDLLSKRIASRSELLPKKIADVEPEKRIDGENPDDFAFPVNV